MKVGDLVRHCKDIFPKDASPYLWARIGVVTREAEDRFDYMLVYWFHQQGESAEFPNHLELVETQ